jgi:glycogen operon protein
MTGGDERLRSQRCNNNPYNLDSVATWLDWSAPVPAFTTFVQRLLAFRAAHAAFRPAAWIEPSQISWRDASGTTANGAYMDDASKPALAWRLDGTKLGDVSPAIYVIYNRGTQAVAATLPPAPAGTAWHRVGDTAAWMEPQGNIAEPGAEYRMNQARYDLAARSLAWFVAR